MYLYQVCLGCQVARAWPCGCMPVLTQGLPVTRYLGFIHISHFANNSRVNICLGVFSSTHRSECGRLSNLLKIKKDKALCETHPEQPTPRLEWTKYLWPCRNIWINYHPYRPESVRGMLSLGHWQYQGSRSNPWNGTFDMKPLSLCCSQVKLSNSLLDMC